MLLYYCNSYFYERMAKIMYSNINTNKHAKPKKIYLAAMALLLMFGSVASPASVAGLETAQAKTTTSVKAATTKKKSQKKKANDPTSGLGYIKDFNTKVAGSKSKVYYEDKANSAALKFGKDTDGYLTFGGKKFKPANVRYFGGGKGSWYKVANGKNTDIHFVKYSGDGGKNANSGVGKTGAVYPNAAKYHNVHQRNLDVTPITIRLTWVAGPKKYSKNAGQITFHTGSIGVSAQGEHSTDSFRVEYFTDTKCKNPLKINPTSGKPAKAGAIKPKTALTFKDIDFSQYIGMRKAKKGKSFTKAYYDNGKQNKKKHQTTKVRPFNYKDYTRNGNLWTGGTAKYKDKDKNDTAADTAGGTISTNDPRGFITFNTTDEHIYDYGHGISENNGNIDASASTGTLKNPSSLKKLPSKYVKSFGNYWKVGASGSQVVRWQPEATKYVSDEGIVGTSPWDVKWDEKHQKYVTKRKGDPGKHGKDGKAEWKSNITLKGKDSFYYGIVTAAAWPATYHKGDDILGINGFGFVDNEINPGLDVESVKVYSQTQKGNAYYDKSCMFTTHFDNDTHKVSAVLKDDFAKPSSQFFNHRWTIVIKVKPNDNLATNQVIKTAKGNRLGAVITNTAQWATPTPKNGKPDSPQPSAPDTIKGGKIGGGTTQIIVTPPVINREPELGSAHKYVFRKTPGSKDSWNDDLSQNYDGGTVYPGQELKYQIRVHMPKIDSDQRFTGIQIEDDPNSILDFTSSKSSSPSASSGQTVTFNGTAKVNENAKTGDVATNTGTVRYTLVTRHTGRNYVGKDDKGNDKYEDYDYETSSDRTMKINTTHNRVVERNIKAPIKTAYAVEDGRLYPLNQLEYGKKFKYVVRQEVGTRNVDTNGDSFELTDNLPKSLKASDLTAKVYRLTKDSANPANAGAKKVGQAKAIDIDDNTSYGVDVTETEGHLKQDGNNFTWVGDVDKMPFKGETYTLVITGIYQAGGDKVDQSNADNAGNDYAVVNTAKSKVDGKENDSNTVTVPVELVQPSLNKDIVAIHDDTTNQDITDFTAILKPQDNYTITYRFTSFAGNEFDGKEYSLSDRLPDNMTIADIGQVKGYIMADDTADDVKENADVAKTVTTSGKGTNKFTMTNSKVKAYGLITVDVKAKVKGQGDWSNYYDRMIYNNGLNNNDKSNKATSTSYMQIPNEASEVYKNSDSLNAKNSASIAFNMGVQMLRIKQYIAQDDAKWTTDLKTSHYLPVADGKTDNSKKAVTTMLVIAAPNYLKNQKVDITDQADNSKVTGNTFDSGGFERGGSDLRLVDNDKAIAYKNDEKKLDVPNLDLKPLTDTANKSTSETVNKQSLPTPGQTYAYEQKYSPTTKFAAKFAKLDKMHGTFSSKVKFYDTTENSHDEYKGINKTSIKLSNIYGYTMRMSKGTYSQDGKMVDIKTYGEQVGLAVDNSNKTNFTNDTDKFNLPDSASDKTNMMDFGTATKSKDNYTDASQASRIGSYDESAEKQPVAIWVVPNGSYTLPQAQGQYAKDQYGHLQTLRLKSNVGQGESVKIGTDTAKDNSMLANINADDFWASNSLHDKNTNISYIGFGSGSARTMTKGHSVVVPVKEPSADHKNDTISANRVSELQYEPYVQHIFTRDANIDHDKHKSINGNKANGARRDRVADVKTDFVKDSTIATNPAQFVTYYDLDKSPEGFAYQSKPAAQRTLREAYWMTAPKSMSAKAGYGLEMPYELHSFTFGATPKDDTLEKLYQTNLQSKDAIFDSGNTKTANDERLGYSYSATQDLDKIKAALNGKDLTNRTTLGSLLDAIDTSDKKHPVVARDDAWLNILPDYNLIDISFRFNNRMLDHGKQSFADHDVMYPDYNKNIFGYVAGKDLVKGGFRNYLRDDLELTNYPLNLYSSTGNRGLIDIPGFGVGYATSFDFTQDLAIYGTRMTTKNDHDAKDSDIIVQPAISGRSAFDHKDLGRDGNEWLKHNDADSLYKNSSGSKLITR